MNLPRDPDHDLDRLLDDDGGELGALYRRLSRVDPPRRLDRTVLAEAARAVHGSRPRRQRWLFGFGSAAGVVLAAGVAWHIGQDALRQDAQRGVRQTPTVVPVEPITETSRRRESAHETSAAPAPPAAPPVAASAQLAPPPAKPAASSAARKAKAAAPPPAPEPIPSAPSETAAPFPAASESAVAAQAAAPAAKAESSGALGASAADQVAPMPARSRVATPPTSSVELQNDMRLAPMDWLAHIHQLLREGRRQQARESLLLFRRAHPDWQLPDDLRALSD